MSIAHYDMRFLKPLDEDILKEVGEKFSRIITIEDGVRMGGMGSAVLEWMNDHDYQPKMTRMGLPDELWSTEPWHSSEKSCISIKNQSKKQLRNEIIIAGAYAIGTHLARLLSRSNEEITLIDESEERLASIGSDCDLLTMLGKPTSLHILRDAGVADADLFIAVTPVESTNITASILAKNLGAKRTVARVDNPEYMDQQAQEFFKELGISKLIYPEMLAAVDINNGLKMSWVRQRWDVHDGALVMLGIKLREGCEILNEPLKNISGPNDPYHVVAIKRGSDTIIPGGNDELKLYDLAYFMTTRNYIPYIRKIVGKEHYVDVKNVMIMGGGRTAVRAVKKMPEYMECKIIEMSEERCEYLNDILDENKTLIIHGDGRDIPLLVEEGIRSTQAFVALTGNAETNILACLTAKRMGVRKTVAAVET